jgi:hypothetical protein
MNLKSFSSSSEYSALVRNPPPAETRHKISASAGSRWLTVVSPEDPDGVQLLLEPDENPAAKAFKAALFAQGTPLASFFVDDIRKEAERMKHLGVTFTMQPSTVGPTAVAILDDTCGNLIQLTQV